MIASGSRYVKTVYEKDGLVVNGATKGTPFVAKRTFTITSSYGDTFEKIAARVLGDSTQWWKIAGLNSDVRFPDVIPVGTTIIVPAP